MKRVVLVLGVLGVIGLVGVLVLSRTNDSAQDGEDAPPPGNEGDVVTYTWTGNVNAPDFPAGLDWINVSEPLTLADLRGRIVLLDFWTYGCINCIHIIPDLKRLEAEYPDQLVVIGVHSAKFDNEGETENIRRIVRRYEIEHPVVNDNGFAIWQQYGVRAWPTVMIIDPFGKIVGQLSGEPLYSRIQPIIDTMAREYSAAGVLDASLLPQWQPELAAMEDTLLRFPGKVLADPEGNRLFISDSNHNRIVIAALDTYEVLDVIGGFEAGLVDGDYQPARFFRPQGLALVGSTLYVADTGNHAIRVVDLDARTVATVAGTGEQGFNRDQSGPGPRMALNSPWDLVAYDGTLYIAMAGPHQLWAYNIASGEIGPYAGSGREALIDGSLRQSALNQPSGIDTNGTVLYFADAEASAIRTADLNPNGEVKTIVGTGLFDFGDVDGVGDAVQLQHALGVTVADDGYLYVADTYNNKIKRIDPSARESTTFAGTGKAGLVNGTAAQFYEPGGIDYANGRLYVADTNNHAIRVIDVATGITSTVEFPNPERLARPAAVLSEVTLPGTDAGLGVLGGQEVITLPPQVVGAGAGTIRIMVTMPDGYKLNGQAPFTAVFPDDPVAQVPAESRDTRLILPEMPLDVPVTFREGQTELALDLTVYWCEAINETLCFVDRSQLVVPLTVIAGGSEQIVVLPRALVPPVIAG